MHWCAGQFNLNAMWLQLRWRKYIPPDINISIYINTIYRSIKEASGWGIFISDFSFLLISFWSPANTHRSFFPSISHCYYIVLLLLLSLLLHHLLSLLLLLLPSIRFDSTDAIPAAGYCQKCYCNNYFIPLPPPPSSSSSSSFPSLQFSASMKK